MSTDLVTTDTKLQLQAINAEQMGSAHEQMRTWITAQIARLNADLFEEDEALNIAERNKWSVTRHKRKCRELQRRIEFFQKIDAALEAGYVIVPNFAMDVFAIRTDRAKPAPNTVNSGSWSVRQQSARVLPVGEGEYRSPVTEVETHEWKEGDQTKRLSHAAGDWLDINFPFALAKPALMNQTAEALALKCFDEIGVAQDHGSNGDPYIIGRIKNPGRRMDISFFIGWYFDPSSL